MVLHMGLWRILHSFWPFLWALDVYEAHHRLYSTVKFFLPTVEEWKICLIPLGLLEICPMDPQKYLAQIYLPLHNKNPIASLLTLKFHNPSLTRAQDTSVLTGRSDNPQIGSLISGALSLFWLTLCEERVFHLIQILLRADTFLSYLLPLSWGGREGKEEVSALKGNLNLAGRPWDIQCKPPGISCDQCLAFLYAADFMRHHKFLHSHLTPWASCKSWRWFILGYCMTQSLHEILCLP